MRVSYCWISLIKRKKHFLRVNLISLSTNLMHWSENKLPGLAGHKPIEPYKTLQSYVLLMIHTDKLLNKIGLCWMLQETNVLRYFSIYLCFVISFFHSKVRFSCDLLNTQVCTKNVAIAKPHTLEKYRIIFVLVCQSI